MMIKIKTKTIHKTNTTGTSNICSECNKEIVDDKGTIKNECIDVEVFYGSAELTHTMLFAVERFCSAGCFAKWCKQLVKDIKL